MKKISLMTVAFLLLSIFLATCLLSFITYSSPLPFSIWHENSGAQFMIIPILVTPIMLLTGIGYHILGKFISINKNIKILSFLSAFILLGLLIIDGSLGSVIIILGTLYSVVAFVTAIFLSVKDLRK